MDDSLGDQRPSPKAHPPRPCTCCRMMQCRTRPAVGSSDCWASWTGWRA